VLSFLPDSWLAGMNAQFEGIPTGKFAFFIGVMCLKGSAIGALSALPYAMAADVIDLDSVRTGKKQGGAYFSIWTMTRKLAYALGLVVGTTAATIVGFNSLADPIENPNSMYSLIWLACLYSIVPAIFKFVAVPMLWRYPLTEEKLKEIQEDIDSGKQVA
jgi:glucuronide carrier protein